MPALGIRVRVGGTGSFTNYNSTNTTLTTTTGTEFANTVTTRDGTRRY